MNRAINFLLLTASLGLAGCAGLPATGPSASAIAKAPEVELVKVTPETAGAARATALDERNTALASALDRLRAPGTDNGYRVAPGDLLDVTLWSFSPWPGSGNPLAIANPGPIPLGQMQVEPDGAVMLPYAGRVTVGSDSLQQAQDVIAARYAALRILQKPTAAVKLVASPSHDVLVTGAIGQPRTIAWTPAGLTLAQAITQSLGDGSATLGQGDLSAARAAIRVSVLRGGAAPVELPISTALEQRIPLRAGDRIVVRKAPAVEVTMLGGGTRRNGVIGFPKQPTLSEALAEANGLDSNSANDHAVFVMRRRDGARPLLYDFAWNRAEGMVAASQFPLEDGDVVYVAEAPMVALQKVIGLLFQASLPVQTLR
jgi:polysaccharide export outer membrane protein